STVTRLHRVLPGVYHWNLSLHRGGVSPGGTGGSGRTSVRPSPDRGDDLCILTRRTAPSSKLLKPVALRRKMDGGSRDPATGAAMPIRFRCVYCNQLLGISRRKAGTIVRCTTCEGQLIVPEPNEAVTTEPAEPKQHHAMPGCPPSE